MWLQTRFLGGYLKNELVILEHVEIHLHKRSQDLLMQVEVLVIIYL